MKRFYIIILLISVLIVSCGVEKDFVPPFFQDLRKSKSEIFESYNLTEEDTYLDWGTERGEYIYPQKVTYLEVPSFSVVFLFDTLDPEQRLVAFAYYRIYKEQSDELLPLVKELYQKLTEWNLPLKGNTGSSFVHMLDSSVLQDLERTDYSDSWQSKDEEMLTTLYFRKNKVEDQWVIAVQYQKNYLKDMTVRGYKPKGKTQ